MSVILFKDQINKYSEVSYGKKNVDAYVEYSASTHGSDGALFLDKYFKPAIENLNGETVLDIGCGAGPWSIYAAKQGGVVCGIDIQPEMIEAAHQKIESAGVQNKVKVSVGDASALTFEDDFFDREISICVGCNLPEGIFEKSFTEMARTLKPQGIAVVGTPYSLDTVFTDGSKTHDEVHFHIHQVLETIPDNPDLEMITEKLSELTEVLSATFYIKDKKLTLVTDEKELQEGEKIWRKLPKPIVPNRYHSQDSYLKAFQENHLNVVKSHFPHFSTEQEWSEYNSHVLVEQALGAEYVTHAPFAIYYVTKNSNA